MPPERTNRQGHVYSGVHIHESRAHLGNNYNYGPSRDQTTTEAILKSLLYSDKDLRMEKIPYAGRDTFEWVFNKDRGDDTSKLRKWLLEGREKLFWIKGKPGSGKSTFMKFLAEHDETEELLRRSVGSRALIVVRHFFWLTGSSLQSSLGGLLRNVLFEIIETYIGAPDVIQRLCPKRWAAGAKQKSWSQAELKRTMLALITLSDAEIVCFIDGLDESCPQHQHEAFVQDVLTLSNVGNVRMCVSSRPWPAFEHAFTDQPNLMLNLLTHSDMEKHILHELRTVEAAYGRSRDFEPLSKEASNLIRTIVRHADGVFLLVELILSSLKTEIRKGRCSSDLVDIVKQSPRDLEEYFYDRIYKRISQTKGNVSDTASALKLAMQGRIISDKSDDDESDDDESHDDEKWHVERSVVVFWLLCRGQLDAAGLRINNACVWRPTVNNDSLLEEVRLFLSEACKDLLVINIRRPYWRSTVDFFHRSVFDFLSSGNMAQIIDKHAPAFLSTPNLKQDLLIACTSRVVVECDTSCYAVKRIFRNLYRSPKTVRVKSLLKRAEPTLADQVRKNCTCKPLHEGEIHRDFAMEYITKLGQFDFAYAVCQVHPLRAEKTNALRWHLEPGDGAGFELASRDDYDLLKSIDSQYVRSLLQLGCDPNASNHPRGDDFRRPQEENSGWVNLLRRFFRHKRQRKPLDRILTDDELREVAETVICLIEYGADMELSICTAHNCHTDCLRQGREVECQRMTVESILGATMPESHLSAILSVHEQCYPPSKKGFLERRRRLLLIRALRASRSHAAIMADGTFGRLPAYMLIRIWGASETQVCNVCGCDETPALCLDCTGESKYLCARCDCPSRCAQERHIVLPSKTDLENEPELVKTFYQGLTEWFERRAFEHGVEDVPLDEHVGSSARTFDFTKEINKLAMYGPWKGPYPIFNQIVLPGWTMACCALGTGLHR